MTNEEMQRTIEFIVGQQAQFATDMQQLRESQAQFQAQTQVQIGKLTDAIITITGVVGRLAEAQTTLTESQARTDAHVAEVAERLNAFITVVERYISEGRDGKQ